MKAKKALVLALNVEKHKNQTLEQSKLGLQNKYDQIKKKNDELKQSIQISEEKSNSDEQIVTVKNLRDVVLDSFEKNRTRTPNLYRYDDEIYEFSKLLLNINAKCYETLRNVIILPSVNQIDEHFKINENCMKDNIQKIEKIGCIIEEYRNLYKVDGILDCILSVDAASLDRPNQKGHSYVFAFYLQPLNASYKCFPIFLHSKENGNANEEIRNYIFEIVKLLKNFGIKILAVATDGDNGYNQNSEETFQRYIEIFEKEGFQAAVEFIIKSDELFWISDLLHLIKIARKRIMKGPMTIQTKLKDFFTSDSLNDILNLGVTLTDKSSVGYMKDFYPLNLFTLENCFQLLSENLNDEFNYFFPFSIWIESIISEKLTKEARKYFLKISFHFFYAYYFQLKHSKFEDGITINKTQNTLIRWFNKENFIIRSMNTIIFTYSLLEIYDDICLNRISSHPIENFFGHIRKLSKNFDSFNNFVLNAIKTQENMIISNKYNIKNEVKNRVNVAGVKIFKNSGSFDLDEMICDVKNIVEFSFLKSDIEFHDVFQAELNPDDYNSFIQILLDYLDENGRIKKNFYRPKMSSGWMIKSRCCGAEMEKKITNGKDLSQIIDILQKQQQIKYQKTYIKKNLEQLKQQFKPQKTDQNQLNLYFMYYNQTQFPINNQVLTPNCSNQTQFPMNNQVLTPNYSNQTRFPMNNQVLTSNCANHTLTSMRNPHFMFNQYPKLPTRHDSFFTNSLSQYNISPAWNHYY